MRTTETKYREVKELLNKDPELSIKEALKKIGGITYTSFHYYDKKRVKVKRGRKPLVTKLAKTTPVVALVNTNTTSKNLVAFVGNPQQVLDAVKGLLQ
jgi:hypothetical protein